MQGYKKVEYKFRDKKGVVLISTNIKNKKEIQEICLRDYLEKLGEEIEIVGGIEDNE